MSVRQFVKTVINCCAKTGEHEGIVQIMQKIRLNAFKRFLYFYKIDQRVKRVHECSKGIASGKVTYEQWSRSIGSMSTAFRLLSSSSLLEYRSFIFTAAILLITAPRSWFIPAMPL